MSALHASPPMPALSPAQATTYTQLLTAVESSHLVFLEGGAGSGKSTLAARLLAERGGVCLTVRDVLSPTANAKDPAITNSVLRRLDDALSRHGIVVFEDFDDLGGDVLDRSFYGQAYIWTSAMHSLLDRARAQGKCLVLTGTHFHHEQMPEWPLFSSLAARATTVKLAHPDAQDYAFHLDARLTDAVKAGIDAGRIFEHAPRLNPYQLNALGVLAAAQERADDEFVRRTIDKRILVSNVAEGETASITFSDLKGFEQIQRDLTTYVLNPIRAAPQFDKLGLRPKRGVLLYGPPGTGKTSVGRALANEMKGKFFLIDGTVVTDPSAAFYAYVQHIFRCAKRAAPSAVFVDDADVLFQSDRGTGLNRYLLSMLDGLESETAGKVAVILTAMNPSDLPPALLRSGRVELWLETRLPAAQARAEMISAQLSGLPAPFRDYDASHAAQISEGFSAADMRRLVADVKALYAKDVLAGKDAKSVAAYFEAAMSLIQHNKELLARAAVGQLKMGASPRDEAGRKASRLRDETSQCGGE